MTLKSFVGYDVGVYGLCSSRASECQKCYIEFVEVSYVKYSADLPPVIVLDHSYAFKVPHQVTSHLASIPPTAFESVVIPQLRNTNSLSGTSSENLKQQNPRSRHFMHNQRIYFSQIERSALPGL